MFRKMRRSKQHLSEDECRKILEEQTAGVLAVSGEEGYPYAVPLSYGYIDGKIVFHGSKIGHKMDAIRSNDKVSFCVVGQDKIVPEQYTTYFKSVIIFGRAKIIEEESEKRRLVDLMAQKYRPGFEAERQAEIDQLIKATGVIVIEIEHMTGKQSKYLAEKKN